MLSQLYQVPITPIDGGFLIKEINGRRICVLRMIFNWRIARSTPGSEAEFEAGWLAWDRAWCFYGTDIVTLLRTVQAALEWDGADDTAPEGWDKNATTGEYAHPEEN